MPSIREEDINAVRQKADIVDIIGHYLPVQKKGKSYVALCPFHDDHSPSMSISPDKQIYKCFVCNAGGNVFSFVQNYEKISFPEAVGRVASLVGYPLDIKEAGPAIKKDPRKEKLYQILNEAIKYMMYELNSSEAIEQKEYLEKRGLDQTIREKFQIGYNPKADKLYQFLKAKGYEDKDLVACNLVRISEDGLHDVFYDRISFPIHDTYGNPIGFSARSINPNNASKYINTNETELFEKGNIVYNYHRARNEARKERCVYVCEGVTDVIAFAKAGIENCVCTLGTACTKQQIHLLKTLAPTVIFCYDGDDAGQRATYKAAKMARSIGLDVKIIKNTSEKDPDELIREEGKDAFLAWLSKNETWMEFVLRYFQRHVNMDNYGEKKEFVQKVLEEINQLEDDMDRQYFTEQLSKISGFNLAFTPKNEVPQAKHLKKTTVALPNGTKEAEELLLQCMLENPEAAHYFEENLGFLNDETRQELAMMIVDAYRTHDVISASELMDSTNKKEIKTLIAKLSTEPSYTVYSEELMKGLARKVTFMRKVWKQKGIRSN